MNIQEVIDFICKTPENTNPNVLKSVLEDLAGGGSSIETVDVDVTTEFESTVLYFTDGTTTPKSVTATSASSVTITPEKNSCMILERATDGSGLSGVSPLFSIESTTYTYDIIFCDKDLQLSVMMV